MILAAFAILATMMNIGEVPFLGSPEVVSAPMMAMNTGGFSRYVKDSKEAVIFIKGSGSCEKCSYIAESMRIEVEKRNIHTIYMVVLNRLKDSVAIKYTRGNQSPIYITRSTLHELGSEVREDSWYYYSADAVALQSGSFTDRGSMEMLLSKLHDGKRLRKKVLSSLDETQSILGQPVFNPYIRDSILVVGSDNELRLDVYNIRTGMRVWHAEFPDSMFVCALSPGERLERDIPMYRPGIWAAEWIDEGRVIFAGRVVSNRHDSVLNRRMIGRRSFIAIIDTASMSCIWKVGQIELDSKIRTRSMTNCQLRYPYLYTSLIPWGVTGEAVYDSYTISRMNLETGETDLFSRLDSVYRILDIEDNVSNGLFCIVEGELWSAQPLSPRINNESTGASIQIAGEHYLDYYAKMRKMARELGGIEGTPLQRYDRYEFESYIKGIYNVGAASIAVLKGNGAKGERLEIYDVEKRSCIWREDVPPGWTLQGRKNTMIRIELDDNSYKAVEYSFLNP
jgi:hypothetical protein